MNGGYLNEDLKRKFSEEIAQVKKLLESQNQTSGITTIAVDAVKMQRTTQQISGALTKYIGDYFEWALYDGLLQAASNDKDIAEVGGQDVQLIRSRKSEIIKSLHETGAPESRIKQLQNQAQSLAQDAGRIFWENYKKKSKERINKVDIEWFGGGGAVGDIHLIINGIHIMVEAKFYADTDNEISYFSSFSDVNHLNPPFWKFLRDIGQVNGRRVWARNDEPKLKTNPWVSNVMDSGFTAYVKALDGNGGTTPKKAISVFNYLISKGGGSANNVDSEIAGNFKVSKRAIISGGKVQAGDKGGKLTVDIDVTSLIPENQQQIEIIGSKGTVGFYKKGAGKKSTAKKLMEISLAKNVEQTLKNNSSFAQDPGYDGYGWVTNLNLTLHRSNLLTAVDRG